MWQLQNWVLVGFLLLVVIASGADLQADLASGVTGLHIFQETVVFCTAIFGIIWITLLFIRHQGEIAELKVQLGSARLVVSHQSEKIKQAKHQLGCIIQQQFSDWQLSASEQEVGLLLLKGLTLKEISAIRNVSEKTIRQQASSIYRKAGLAGRHTFSAWFLEDLF